ncbi:MAG TPA: energy transducer TonB [Polyangiales bacterium]|jgi:protein TonB
MLRLSPLGSKAAALIASTVFHVGAVALAATRPTSMRAAQQAAIDVELLPASTASDESPATHPVSAPRTQAGLPHTPAARAHPRANTLVAHHRAESLAALPHFDLAPATSIERASPVRLALSGTNISAAASGGARANGTVDTFSAGRVSAPARLLTAAPVTYPIAARRAELEATVPVEIVIDERGRVIEAHAIGRAGYGLDEEAVRAINNYRFAPAEREGRAVRVRVRWDVLFRLR